MDDTDTVLSPSEHLSYQRRAHPRALGIGFIALTASQAVKINYVSLAETDN